MCFRIQIVPSLHQLQHDLGVFLVSAVKDLSKSIEHLEKAQSEYRAAMLWLRNASTKLDDPDASKQLNKFREVKVVKCECTLTSTDWIPDHMIMYHIRSVTEIL